MSRFDRMQKYKFSRSGKIALAAALILGSITMSIFTDFIKDNIAFFDQFNGRRGHLVFNVFIGLPSIFIYLTLSKVLGKNYTYRGNIFAWSILIPITCIGLGALLIITLP